MKTAVVEVGGLLSVLSAEGVRKQLQKLSGVHHAEVNYVAQSATVHYDEQQITLDDIRKRVVECGYHCRGEMVPNHLCETPGGTPSATVPAAAGHEHHGHHHEAASAAMTATGGCAGTRARLSTTRPMRPPVRPAKGAAHAKHEMADMMHDMGHGAGMSMQDMVRDMRNRFFVALIFAIPVFLYSPMGKMFGDFPTPFGMDRKIFLFVVGTAAIIYPAWPFFVAAWRAARNGVLNMATLVVLSVGTGYSVQRRRHLLLRRRRFLRSLGGAAGVHPARSLAGNARPRRCLGRDPRADGSGAAQGGGPARWPRGRGRDGRGTGRRHRDHPAGQQDSGRRRDHRRLLAGRRVDADRRIDAGKEGARRQGHRRDDQQERQLSLPCDQGRCRYGAGADRQAGAGGAELEGARSTAGRSRIAVARARRHRDRRDHVRGVVLVAGSAAAVRSRADDYRIRHRLPGCARSRDADGRDGGHGTGRDERHSLQERLGPGERDQAHRDRLRQDRNAHAGPA